MKHVLSCLKGIAIGVAIVIPGFSGGAMALILRVYEEFINALANALRHPLQVLKQSGMLFLGIALGCVISLFTIKKLLEIAPLITIMFFIGLVFGSIPDQVKTNDFKAFDWRILIPFVIAIVVIIGLPLIPTESVADTSNFNVGLLVVILLLGILSSAAMVVPGAGGSVMLMIFGFYEYVLGMIIDTMLYALTFNFDALLQPFLVTLFFGIGCIIGLTLIAKIIKVVYAKFTKWWNAAITGLFFASPIAILISAYKENTLLFAIDWWQYLLAVLVMILGAALTLYITWYANKKSVKL